MAVAAGTVGYRHLGQVNSLSLDMAWSIYPTTVHKRQHYILQYHTSEIS